MFEPEPVVNPAAAGSDRCSSQTDVWDQILHRGGATNCYFLVIQVQTFQNIVLCLCSWEKLIYILLLSSKAPTSSTIF